MNNAGPADHDGIYDLFARYTAALDEPDVEALVDCFLPDGSLESPTLGVCAGHDKIRAFASRFARYQTDAGVQMRHFFFNLATEASDAGAHAAAYVLITHSMGSRTVVQPPGRYDCTLAQIGGRWAFATRRVIMDADATMLANV